MPVNPITVLEGWSGTFGRLPRRRRGGLGSPYSPEYPFVQNDEPDDYVPAAESPSVFSPADYTRSVSIPEGWAPPRRSRKSSGGRKNPTAVRRGKALAKANKRCSARWKGNKAKKSKCISNSLARAGFKRKRK